MCQEELRAKNFTSRINQLVKKKVVLLFLSKATETSLPQSPRDSVMSSNTNIFEQSCAHITWFLKNYRCKVKTVWKHSYLLVTCKCYSWLYSFHSVLKLFDIMKTFTQCVRYKVPDTSAPCFCCIIEYTHVSEPHTADKCQMFPIFPSTQSVMAPDKDRM